MRWVNQRRLEKARRETLRRMREDYYGPTGALVQATPMGLALAIQAAVPWVKQVSWNTLDEVPLLATARLRFKWTVWLLPIVLHFLALRRARAVIERYKAAGTTVLVSVW